MDAHHALRAVSSGKQPGAGPQPASSGLSSCVTPPATTSQQPAQLGTHNSVFTMDTASHGESASNSTLNSPSQPINLAADTALGATSAHLPHTGLQLPPLRSYKSHSTMNPASPSFRQNRHPFLIGVAGGTASGKTTVCDSIMQRLHDQCVVMLAQDSFYRGLTPDELEDVKNFNFDHPDAIDWPALLETLFQLSKGKPVEVPVYDFTTHQRSSETREVEPADVIIVEGILVLAVESVRNMLHMKVYVDTDDDVRLARRIQRDVAERGRDVGGVIEQYTRFVKPAFDQFIGPSRRYADIIIPWQRGDNTVAIDLITEHIRLKLQQHDLLRIYPNLEVIPSNFQVRGMHTILRDRETSKNDFVFYANRLNRLLVEAGLGHLPFSEKTVITPTGHPYVGVDFAKGLCGVSVIRSGEAMEAALRECCQGIKIGKILVHRHGANGTQELVYQKLPSDIAGRFVLLMDPVLGTGNTATKAIQVLLSKGVQESKILFLCLIAAPAGIHKVCKMFPKLKIVTTEIDKAVDDNFQVVPGVGEFGDRYFCH